MKENGSFNYVSELLFTLGVSIWIELDAGTIYQHFAYT
ncbi:CRISPR-associated helicase Cas3 family [Photorhabdus temperata subsp. temperata M1021]|nr:CRISPR-associated helicase Cas3 family [Photorhabdus temperata subsp. temperata M1021]